MTQSSIELDSDPAEAELLDQAADGKSDSEQKEIRRCPVCYDIIEGQPIRCWCCGNILDDSRAFIETTVSDRPAAGQRLPDEELLELFIGHQSRAYIDKWHSRNPESRVSLNLAAFVLGVIWMGYRKMYWQAILVTAATNVLYLYFGEKVMSYFNAIPIIICVLGNQLYYRHCRAKISEIKRKRLTLEAEKEAVIRAGGVSLLGALVPVLVIVAFVLIGSSVGAYGETDFPGILNL